MGAWVTLMAALGSAPVLIDLLNDFLGLGPRRDFFKFFFLSRDRRTKRVKRKSFPDIKANERGNGQVGG